MSEKHPAARYMPWWGDMARHPDAPFIEFYSTGRCQNPEEVICPYCGERQDDYWDAFRDEEHAELECGSCEREFRAQATFGYGYSTYPKECAPTEHRYVFTAQYQYKGKLRRPMGCTQCGHQLFHLHPPGELMLPWLDEYGDPSYFDPDGTLVSTVEPRPTPVLDCLRDGWGRWSNTWNSDQMATALRKHDEHYGAQA